MAKKAPAKKLTAEQKEIAKAIEAAPFLSEHDKKQQLEGLASGYDVKAPRLAKFTIKAYDGNATRPIDAQTSFYDADTCKFSAFEAGEPGLYEVLDCIAHASEAGKLNSRAWVKALFKAPGTFDWFLEELEGYDECYRITDRWWYALAKLAEHEHDEEGFVRTEDMATALREHAEETGQL